MYTYIPVSYDPGDNDILNQHFPKRKKKGGQKRNKKQKKKRRVSIPQNIPRTFIIRINPFKTSKESRCDNFT